MSQLQLNRDQIYARVAEDARIAGIAFEDPEQVNLLTDVILEEMKRQYLQAKRR